MSFTSFMRQTATIFDLADDLTDASGGVYQHWNQVAQSPCMVRPTSGGVDREQVKDGSAATHIVFLPGAWSLTAANQIHVDESIYNVIRSKDINSLGHHTEVECVVETS